MHAAHHSALLDSSLNFQTLRYPKLKLAISSFSFLFAKILPSECLSSGAGLDS